MSRRKPPRFERQDSVFIDPKNCGSTIQWIVQYTASGRRTVDVVLRDCDKKVTWSAYDYCGNTVRQARSKLGIAIQQLQACLAAVNEMERRHPQRKRKT